jgi:hypothetical protein
VVEHPYHASEPTGPVVETGDGLHALANAHHHHQDAVDDAKRAHAEVPLIAHQLQIQNHGHQTRADLHEEGQA